MLGRRACGAAGTCTAVAGAMEVEATSGAKERREARQAGSHQIMLPLVLRSVKRNCGLTSFRGGDR